VFARLLLLFTLVPALELALLIVIGREIGVLPTLGIILATGFAGAWLARREGLRTWREFRSSVSSGALPGDALQQGLAILVGGALLLTPGVLTDIAGMVLLLPVTRQAIVRAARRRLEAKLLEQSTRVELRSWSRQPPPL
jgi:UPF0716 protein FxsA